MKKMVVSILVSVMMVPLWGCQGSETSDITDSDLDLSETESAQDPDSQSEVYEIGDTGETFINNANVFASTDTISIEGFSFSGFSSAASKSLPQGVDKDEVIYFSESVDDAGNILDDHTYLFGTVTISNDLDETQDIYLNSCRFVVLDGENKIIANSGELRHRSAGDSEMITRDFAKASLAAHESKEFTVGYIMDDSEMETGDLFFIADSTIYGEQIDAPGYEHYKVYRVD